MSSSKETTRYQSALGRAINLWNRGREVSSMIIQELVADGYDVRLLRAHHFKPNGI